MIAELFGLLIETTLAITLAAALVLALRRPVRRLVGARSAYALWLLLPAVGLAVLLPARSVTLEFPRGEPVSLAATQTVAPAQFEAPFDATPWWLAAWIAGALVIGFVLAWQQRRFRRALGRLSPRSDGSLLAEHVDAGPAVIGLLRGRIVLPADFDSRYTDLERDLVLRHERAHLTRRDPLANLAAAILRCLYWFNPLLHYAVGRFRFDQELAVDAAVLAQRPEARRTYADAMLKTQLMLDPPPLGCHWQSAHPLMERIAMLKQPLPGPTRLAAGFAFALLLSGATGYAAWASQPEQIVMAGTTEGQGVATVHLIRDGQRVKSARFSETIGARLGVDDGDLKLRFSFEELNLEDVLVSGEFSQGEEVLGRPLLRIKRGTKGVIGIGKMREDGMPELGAEFDVPPASEFSVDDAQGLAERANAALNRPIDASGKSASLRAAVLSVAQAAGFPVSNPEVLDDTDKSIDFTFEQTPALQAIAGMVKGAGLTVAVRRDGTVWLDKTKESKLGGLSDDDAAMSEQRAEAKASELANERRAKPPKYPADALRRGVQGKVMLKVEVSAEGRAMQARLDREASSPDIDASLVTAALDAVKGWTFEPARNAEGQAVEGSVLVPVTFSLSEKEATSTLPTPPPHLVAKDEALSPMPTYNRIAPPKYPQAAIDEKREGKVLLRVLVGTDGLVQQVEVESTSGSADLDASAMATVRGWKFNPAHDGYKALPAWIGVPVDFSLTEKSSSPSAHDRALEEVYVRPKATAYRDPAPGGSEHAAAWTAPPIDRWLQRLSSPTNTNAGLSLAEAANQTDDEC